MSESISYRHIIVGVDLSEDCPEVIQRAAGIARDIGGSSRQRMSAGRQAAGRDVPAAVRIGRARTDKVRTVIDLDGAARLGGTADFTAIAGIDHWCGRRHRVHRDGSR